MFIISPAIDANNWTTVPYIYLDPSFPDELRKYLEFGLIGRLYQGVRLILKNSLTCVGCIKSIYNPSKFLRKDTAMLEGPESSFS